MLRIFVSYTLQGTFLGDQTGENESRETVARVWEMKNSHNLSAGKLERKTHLQDTVDRIILIYLTYVG
jgi:hypothetical protein